MKFLHDSSYSLQAYDCAIMLLKVATNCLPIPFTAFSEWRHPTAKAIYKGTVVKLKKKCNI